MKNEKKVVATLSEREKAIYKKGLRDGYTCSVDPQLLTENELNILYAHCVNVAKQHQEPPKKITLVVAGNFREYRYFLRENNLDPAKDRVKFVESQMSLKGLHGADAEVVYYGSWARRKDMAHIRMEICLNGIKEQRA